MTGDIKYNGRAHVELPPLSLGGGQVWQVGGNLDCWIDMSLIQITSISFFVMLCMKSVVPKAKVRGDQ